MARSIGFRFFVAGIMTLLMFVPQFFASEVINSRAEYSRKSIDRVSHEWGGAQGIGGPVLVVPVSAEVSKRTKLEVIDPSTGFVMIDPQTGATRYRYEEQTVSETRPPVYLFPEELDLQIENSTEERHRGLFDVPVYKARAQMAFAFDTKRVEAALEPEETPDWSKAELQLPLAETRSLRGEITLRAGERQFELGPMRDQRYGVMAELGDPRDLGRFAFHLGFNGAKGLSLLPVGRNSHFQMQSDWPHPSFEGAFLPDSSDVTDQGFRAEWVIPQLAISLPQVAREDVQLKPCYTNCFGVKFFQPNDFYLQAFRAARYGILFIALTFLTVLMVEDRVNRPTHPVQYVFIGLAQSLFVVLMLALAERIGFGLAYFLAAGATIGLLTAYGWSGLQLGRRSLALGAALIAIYGLLYAILQAKDSALLIGALMSFAALALVMFATRNEAWYGPEGMRRGWFARKASTEAQG